MPALTKMRLSRLPTQELKPGDWTRPEGGVRIFGPAGELAQILNGVPVQFVGYIEFQPEATAGRANHYHRLKQEWIYVIRGRLRGLFADVESGDIRESVCDAGDLIFIPPMVAHLFIPLEHTDALEIHDRAYDPSDTIRHVIPADQHYPDLNSA